MGRTEWLCFLCIVNCYVKEYGGTKGAKEWLNAILSQLASGSGKVISI